MSQVEGSSGSWWDSVQETIGSTKDGFLDILSGVKDNYVEITKAIQGEGASGSGYTQTKGVENTGQGVTTTATTGNSWFVDNWLLILFAIIVLIGVIAAVKWVL